MFSAPLVPLVNGALLLVLLITHGGVGAAASSNVSGYIQTVVSGGLPKEMYGIACEPYSMDLFISGYSTNNILHVDLTTWTLPKTFAGSTSGSSGRVDGIRTAARFNNPIGMMWSEHLTAFLIADYGNNNIRKMTTGGSVATYAGSLFGSHGSGDGLAIQARFHGPAGIAQVGNYGVAVADEGNSAIRIIDFSGLVTTLAVAISNPWALVASSSFIYTNDGFSLMRFDLSGSKTTLAGSSSSAGSTNGVGTAALFGWIRGITLLPDDDVLVTSNNTVRHIRNEGDFYVSTYIGNLRSTDIDGFGTNASLRDPRGLQYLSTGIGDFVFVCTSWHLRIIEAPAAPPTTQAPTYESSASAGSVVDSTSAISTSVIVAICVLSVVVLSALVALVVFFLKRPTQRNGTSTTTPPPPETTPPPPAATGFQRGGAVQGTVVVSVQPQPQPPPAYSAGEYLYPYPAEGEQDVEVVVEQQPAVSRGQQQQQSEPGLCLTKDVPSVSV